MFTIQKFQLSFTHNSSELWSFVSDTKNPNCLILISAVEGLILGSMLYILILLIPSGYIYTETIELISISTIQELPA